VQSYSLQDISNKSGNGDKDDEDDIEDNMEDDKDYKVDTKKDNSENDYTRPQASLRHPSR
jgi:hypothetical protein